MNYPFYGLLARQRTRLATLFSFLLLHLGLAAAGQGWQPTVVVQVDGKPVNVNLQIRKGVDGSPLLMVPATNDALNKLFGGGWNFTVTDLRATTGVVQVVMTKAGTVSAPLSAQVFNFVPGTNLVDFVSPTTLQLPIVGPNVTDNQSGFTYNLQWFTNFFNQTPISARASLDAVNWNNPNGTLYVPMYLFGRALYPSSFIGNVKTYSIPQGNNTFKPGLLVDISKVPGSNYWLSLVAENQALAIKVYGMSGKDKLPLRDSDFKDFFRIVPPSSLPKEAKTTGGKAGQPISVNLDGLDFTFDKTYTFGGYNGESVSFQSNANSFGYIPAFNVKDVKVTSAGLYNFNLGSFGFSKLNLGNISGVDFTEFSVAGLEVDEATNVVNFIMNAKATGQGATLNASVESERLKKVFLQTLAIPNHKQYISLDLLPNPTRGYANADPAVKRTDFGRFFFEADEQMKKDLMGKVYTGTQAGLYAEWTTLVKQSPHWPTLNAAHFNAYPNISLRAIIYPEVPAANKDGKKVFIQDAKLNMRRFVDALTLDLAPYAALPQVVKDDLNARVETYRGILFARLDGGIAQTLPSINAGNGAYRNLKGVLSAIVAAHWYKTLNVPNKPYAELIDSGNLTGIETDVPFDQAGWDARAYQALGTENFTGLDGNAYRIDYRGGINFDRNDINPSRFTTGLTTTQQAIVEQVQVSQVQNGSSYFADGGGANASLPEFGIGRLDYIPNTPRHEGYVVGKPSDLQVEFTNSGNVAATAVPVSLYDQVLDATGAVVQTTFLGAFSVNSLPAGGKSTATFSYTPGRVGPHKISVFINTATVSDNITPQRELNPADNTKAVWFDVSSNIPTVTILTPVASALVPSDNVRLAGSAFDAGDADLVYQWRSDRDGILGTSAVLTVPSLSVGTHVLTFSARNDLNITIGKTRTITTYAQTAPVVALTAPANNTAVIAGTVTTLQATATTEGEGNLCSQPEQVTWTSSLDGRLGQGCALPVVLSVGTHTLTVSVSNASQKTTTRSISVTVAAPTGSQSVGTQPCVGADLTVGNVPLTGVATYSAGNLLTSRAQLSVGANVELRAGRAIVLTPGFVARRGSRLRAYIGGCPSARAATALSTDLAGTDAPLASGYPNPFTRETTLAYTLTAAETVTIVVYNALGIEVARPLVAQAQPAGQRQVLVDGRRWATGLYHVQVLSATGRPLAQVRLLKAE